VSGTIWSLLLLTPDARLKRLHFRAHHRGTKEADLIIGGFFDAHSETWDDDAVVWFEALVDEEDADLLSWIVGQAAPPAAYDTEMMRAMRRLDYVTLPQ
jgi:antitoxin CptB